MDDAAARAAARSPPPSPRCDRLDAAAAAAAQPSGRPGCVKPAGSLGRLEALSVQLAGLAGRCPPPVPAHPAVAIFAADHGVVAAGVTPWPSGGDPPDGGRGLRRGAPPSSVLARQVGRAPGGRRRRRAGEPLAPARRRCGIGGCGRAAPIWPHGPALSRRRRGRRARRGRGRAPPQLVADGRRPARDRRDGHRQHHPGRGGRSPRSPAPRRRASPGGAPASTTPCWRVKVDVIVGRAVARVPAGADAVGCSPRWAGSRSPPWPGSWSAGRRRACRW